MISGSGKQAARQLARNNLRHQGETKCQSAASPIHSTVQSSEAASPFIGFQLRSSASSLVSHGCCVFLLLTRYPTRFSITVRAACIAYTRRLQNTRPNTHLIKLWRRPASPTPRRNSTTLPIICYVCLQTIVQEKGESTQANNNATQTAWQ